MLIFPGMLVEAAKQAGMPVPPDPDTYAQEDFPHFAVFCNAQLCRPMGTPSEHWRNAHVISAIPVDKIRKVSLADLLDVGFEYRQ